MFTGNMKRILALVLVVFATLVNGVVAQEPSPVDDDTTYKSNRTYKSQETQNSPGSEQTDSARTDPESNDGSSISPAEIDQWIAELGAREFAVRERAADRLTQVGTDIVPRLREVAESSDDPEIRFRAREIVRQLSEGNLQARIDRFLAGEDVSFEGWEIIRDFFGDTHGARELFVELMTQHPLLTQSLEHETRDRVVAMDAVMSRVQDAMNIERRFPNRADTFALLLTAADTNVPINSAFESMLLNSLRQTAVRDIRRDWQLNRPFEALLVRWMMRSSMANRREVLDAGMQLNLDATRDLALQTLRESNEPSTLTAAIQVISRFGDRRHAEQLRPLLEDTRVLAAQGIASGQGFSTQLGDVAMAGIALLYKMPLEDLGFRDVLVHPNIGFRIDEVGFSQQEQREAAKAKIESLFVKP